MTCLRSCDMNVIADACKFTSLIYRQRASWFAASPIAFILHERKQVVIQFLNNRNTNVSIRIVHTRNETMHTMKIPPSGPSLLVSVTSSLESCADANILVETVTMAPSFFNCLNFRCS